MTSVNELKDALRGELEERGILNQVRALMRKSIFEAIESDNKPKPKLSDENLLLNELIREYLQFNNYLNTNSVFMAESGQPINALDRNIIAKELNITEDASSKKVPLLYGIIFGLKKESFQPIDVKRVTNTTNFNLSGNYNNMNAISNMNPMSSMVGPNQSQIEQRGQGIPGNNQPGSWEINN